MTTLSTLTPILATGSARIKASSIRPAIPPAAASSIFYSVLVFCLAFMVWGCLRRLTSISDEMRDLRKDLVRLSKPTRPGFTAPPPLPEKQTYSERLTVQDGGVKPAPPPWVRGWWQSDV